MNDPLEDTLRTALRERGDQIVPTPALPGILHRASRTQAPRRRWLPVGVAALATAGVLTGAVLILGPDVTDGPGERGPVASESAQKPGADPTTNPTSEPSGDLLGDPVTVEPGTEVLMALHVASGYRGGALISSEFAIDSSGDVGVDAVQALLEADPGEPFVNYWARLDADPSSAPMRVRSVLVGDELVNVDFNRFLGVTCPPGADCPRVDGQLALQQLVQTLHSALRTELPVRITVNGEPADEAFSQPLDGALAADPSVAPGIRVTSPEQGATVSSPVVVSGESTSFEGNVVWQVWRDGDPVQQGFTTGGSMGAFAPFEFSVDLPRGGYTIAMWEENAAGDAEGLARRLSPVYLDVTVQ